MTTGVIQVRMAFSMFSHQTTVDISATRHKIGLSRQAEGRLYSESFALAGLRCLDNSADLPARAFYLEAEMGRHRYPLGTPVQERLFGTAIVSKTGCWEWQGAKTTGYGVLQVNNHPTLAHRLAYELCVGKIPEGYQVMHECDNRSCINPAHLRTGTNSDNVADMMSKGRNARGSKMGNAKLSTEDVDEIRRLYATGEYSHKDLSKKFGVASSHISNIINRVWWSWRE